MSNSLVVVTVPDEDALIELIFKAQERDLFPTVFRESDYRNQITAIALPPVDAARRLCSNLPLGGRVPVHS